MKFPHCDFQNFCRYAKLKVVAIKLKKKVNEQDKLIAEMQAQQPKVKRKMFKSVCTVAKLIRNDCLHTVWKSVKFSLTAEIFREINSLVTSLGKTLISRTFCKKSAKVNFCNFQTVRVKNAEFYVKTHR